MNGDPLSEAIDWRAFLARHDPVWTRLPMRWENGLFLGNGLLGALLHVDRPANRLRVCLGRSDVGRMDDLLPDNHHRKPIGSLDLVPVATFMEDGISARLGLWDAEATGRFPTRCGSVGFTCFVPREPEVVAIDLALEGCENELRHELLSPSGGERSTSDGIELFHVDDGGDPRGGGFAVAWASRDLGQGRRRVCVAVGSSPACRAAWRADDDGRSAAREATDAVAAALAEPIEAIRERHRERWHRLYPRSFVSFGHTELESHYWIQLYKLRSAGRPDGPMIDNHGPWTTETRYGFATWDMNVQAIHRLHMPTGHLEMGDALTRFMDASLNPAAMHHAEAGELRAGVGQRTFLRHHPHKDADADGACKLLWACHNLWLQYRHTLDERLLAPLADKLAAGINAYVADAARGEDGLLHVAEGYSWEAYKRVPDPTNYLAVVDWALRARERIDELLGRERDPRWAQLRGELPPYPADEGGWQLAPGYPPVPHRHWSQLMQVWPFLTTSPDDPAQRERIERSVDRWVDLSAGPRAELPRAGFAVAAAIALYAHLGRPDPIPDLAEIYLREWSNRGPCCWASTLYREHGPVIESPLLFADALLATMLQSWDGVVRVFPAWPDAWGDAVFRGLCAEGRVRVSAARNDGATAWIALETDRVRTVALRGAPKDFRAHGLDPSAVSKRDDETLQVPLQPGEPVLLHAPDVAPPARVAPVAGDPERENAFGLNERFLAPRRGKERPDRITERGRGLAPW